ncbi:MAG TPA: hypothetical protein VJY35_09755 [Candidatus Eisenbacteria bacterium]|nr:hypothetical protein [Candidatus Eisenbacteria bacterium]
MFTDAQLLNAAYSSTFSGPADFYAEPPDTPNRLYVNTTTVVGPGQSNTWIELSTEDTAQARAWAVASMIPHSVVDPDPPNVTSRYIEFIARDGAYRTSVRAHRAGYLDRSDYDRFHPGATYGRLMVRPVDDHAVQGVAEYLWFLWHDGYRPKPLTSFSRPSQGSILHTIFYIHVLPAFEFSFHDTVVLLRQDYRIDTTTGAITFRETRIRYVTGY